MKLFSNSIFSSLKSRLYSFQLEVGRQLFRTVATRTHRSSKGWVNDSLYGRISPLGDPNVSVMGVLDQWVREGKPMYKGELQRIINELSSYRRFKHALEVSLWMTNKGKFSVAPFDVSVRLKLIAKVFGLEQVENYFSKIPENLKEYPHVYLALLNCYTVAKSVDKAESVMQKARDLGYASKPIWYNLMMNLHCKLGNGETVQELFSEMEAKGICPDQFTYSVCLSTFAMASDAGGMDKVLKIMESNPRVIMQWRTYVIAVESFLRMGLIDKALEILKKLEGQLSASKQNHIVFVFLIKLYAETGKLDELYRIWDLYRQNGKVLNKVYSSMMRSLKKFDDIEGMVKIFEEWKLSGLSFDFRVPNFLIDAYCEGGFLEKAEALITEGISKGGDPQVSTWCHLAGGYLKKNQMPKAVEALKEAISVCPPKFMSQKDSLTTCLKCLESRDRIEKAEELIKFIRAGSLSREAVLDDSCGMVKDEELQSCPEYGNSNGLFVIEDD